MTHKEFWKFHNENYKRLVSEARILQLEQPHFNDYLNSGMADVLEKLIIEAKKFYYTTGNPLMSDQEYDKTEELLRNIKPESSVLQKVGYEIDN